ncbi:hypothetical protein IAS59_002770 [Cryptococcus gattii]
MSAVPGPAGSLSSQRSSRKSPTTLQPAPAEFPHSLHRTASHTSQASAQVPSPRLSARSFSPKGQLTPRIMSRRGSAQTGIEYPYRTLSRTSSPKDAPSYTPAIETQAVRVKRDHESGKWMINQYRVLSEIGSGTHGRVRLGQDMTAEIPAADDDGDLHPPASPDNSFYAIKIVDRNPKRKRLTGLGRHKGSIRKEIAIFKKVNHPNVVRMKEIIDDPESSKIYMILEWCRNGEIRWKDGEGLPALTVGETRKIFRDTLLGLEYLHHQGIIHRDIKPSNLLRSGDNTVKISDFGCSHFSEALRAAAAQPGPEADAYVDDIELAKTAGSPAFFAPEMCYSGLDSEGPSRAPSACPNQEVPSFTLRPPSGIDTSADSSSSSLMSLPRSSNTFPLKPTNSNDSASSRHPPSFRSQSSSATIQRRERLPITNAIDVWALGVTLYCLLFGKTPFNAPNEYLLMQVIVSEPYIIPPFMGKDRLPTGTGGLPAADEAQHPFTLHGLPDPAAWLVKTDPHTHTFVTVSNDEVAAVITKSVRFRDRFRKGIKTISQKLQLLGTGRTRSHSFGDGESTGTNNTEYSLTPAGSTSHCGTPKSNKLSALLPVSTPSRDVSPMNSPLPHTSAGRRFSLLNGRSPDYPVSPQTSTPSAHIVSPGLSKNQSALDFRNEPAGLVSSTPGPIGHGRLPSHLVPQPRPSIVPLLDDTTHSPRPATSSVSLDKLKLPSDQQSINGSFRRRKSVEVEMEGRRRSHSNASSISSKLARLLRTGSQRSYPRVLEKEQFAGSDAEDMAAEPSVGSSSPADALGRMSLESSLPRQSLEHVETGSRSSSQGYIPSPDFPLPAGWESRFRTNAPRRGSNLSEEFTNRVAEEEIDWDGSISDGDDYDDETSHSVAAPTPLASLNPLWRRTRNDNLGLGLDTQPSTVVVSAAPTLEPIPDGSPSAPTTLPNRSSSSSRPTLPEINTIPSDPLYRTSSRTSSRLSNSPFRNNLVERARSPYGGYHDDTRNSPRRTGLNRQTNAPASLDNDEDEGLAISFGGKRGRKGSVQKPTMSGDK